VDAKTVSKVGLVVLLALVLGGGLYVYLSRFNPNSYIVKVTFDNTKGLSKQSVVRMQGVNIGEVTNIELDTMQRPIHPVVTLAIRNDKSIPSNFEFAIVSGILISTPQIEVRPPLDKRVAISNDSLPKDGTAEVIGAADLGLLASVSPALAETVDTLNHSFSNLNDKFNKTFVKLDKTLDRVQPILINADRLVRTTSSLRPRPDTICRRP
jgi:ABC-type transporter Mla subunit MlaD